MHRIRKQPLGHVTRGKTAAVRLRRLDRFVERTEGPLLARRTGRWSDAIFVDLGYGRVPQTTLESVAGFRALNPDLAVWGIEIEPERVAIAQQWANAQTHFIRGGFEAPARIGRPIRLIRAMNVLRQYPEDAVAGAHDDLLRALMPGGLLVEGTCNPSGAHMVVNLLGPRPHRLLFSVNLRHPLGSPRDLQPVLPKNFIHRVLPGEPIEEFMAHWEDVWRRTAHTSTFGTRVHFAAAGKVLMQERDDVVRRPGLLRCGYLMWRPPTPHPRQTNP